MRYFFHIFDGSGIHPDDVGNNLPSFECAKRIAYVVADELKKGDEISQPSLVIVADADDSVLFACAPLERKRSPTLSAFWYRATSGMLVSPGNGTT